MRAVTILLAVASLSACHESSGQKVGAPAALTFDGATGDAAAIRAHGERLSHILGCRGCHGPKLEGHLFNDDTPDLGKLYASNLTRVLPTMSDAQLKPAFSAKAKAMIAGGKLHPAAFYVAEFKAKTPPDLGPKLAFGRYLASTTCSECHGPDLTGVPDFGPHLSTPDLDIAGTYSDAELARLLSTGQGRTPRDLGLMKEVGEKHFGYLTAHERSAVIAYVKARAAR